MARVYLLHVIIGDGIPVAKHLKVTILPASIAMLVGGIVIEGGTVQREREKKGGRKGRRERREGEERGVIECAHRKV